ncbi:MAG: hypothetical protein QM743_02010 [Chitinophagaceae bacterium]
MHAFVIAATVVFPARAQKKTLRIAADTVASGTEAATLRADSSVSDSVKLAAKDSLKGNASLEQLGLKVSRTLCRKW